MTSRRHCHSLIIASFPHSLRHFATPHFTTSHSEQPPRRMLTNHNWTTGSSPRLLARPSLSQPHGTPFTNQPAGDDASEPSAKMPAAPSPQGRRPRRDPDHTHPQCQAMLPTKRCHPSFTAHELGHSSLHHSYHSHHSHHFHHPNAHRM
jgi:hypothetical protein